METETKHLYNALEAIRSELSKPRDYSHPPSIATLLDDIDGIATLACAKVWAAQRN